MTIQEKANYLFQKFQLDFDNCDCETNNVTEQNYAYNRFISLKFKYLLREENEKVRDFFSILCNRFSI